MTFFPNAPRVRVALAQRHAFSRGLRIEEPQMARFSELSADEKKTLFAYAMQYATEQE